MPTQACLGLGAGSGHIEADEHLQPTKMRHGFLRRDRNHRHIQPPAHRLGYFAAADPFFADRMITRARFAFLQGLAV